MAVLLKALVVVGVLATAAQAAPALIEAREDVSDLWCEPYPLGEYCHCNPSFACITNATALATGVKVAGSLCQPCVYGEECFCNPHYFELIKSSTNSAVNPAANSMANDTTGELTQHQSRFAGSNVCLEPDSACNPPAWDRCTDEEESCLQSSACDLMECLMAANCAPC